MSTETVILILVALLVTAVTVSGLCSYLAAEVEQSNSKGLILLLMLLTGLCYVLASPFMLMAAGGRALGRLYSRVPVDTRGRVACLAEKAVGLYLYIIIALWLLIVFVPILIILTML